MARKTGPTIPQEELYPLADEPAREELDDTRLLDLDVEQESPFLRAQKRVSVRRGSLPRKTATRLAWATIALGVALLCVVATGALYHYGERSWRFRVISSDDIEVTGLGNVPHSQVMEVMGGDIGRNIFFVPLGQRQRQLEQIPWVESASVMRFVPNRLKVEIHERTPIAFARVGSKILLVDPVGTLMELPGRKKYSFPVILGMNSGEPLSTRAARMRIYKEVVSQLDSGGARYSQDLSEVDLSDPDDVKVLANNPQGEVLVHLGSSNYLDRYKVYVSHVQEWRQQFDKVESVDLRYDRQIIVNPDLQGTIKQAPLSASAAKKAMAAGVKPAALISHVAVVPKPPPTASATPAKTPLKPATKKTVVRKRRSKRAAKRAKAKAEGKPSSVASPKTMSDAVKAAKKPSPAIAKEQEHP
jgi:cell division protein FtsQ